MEDSIHCIFGATDCPRLAAVLNSLSCESRHVHKVFWEVALVTARNLDRDNPHRRRARPCRDPGAGTAVFKTEYPAHFPKLPCFAYVLGPVLVVS